MTSHAPATQEPTRVDFWFDPICPWAETTCRSGTNGVLLVAGTDGFFELKRSRTRDPIFD